jgi:transmembrane sensor
MPDPPDAERPVDRALLIRYITGGATLLESLAVDRWAAADGTNRAELAALREMWAVLGESPPGPAYDADAAWARLKARLGQVPALTLFRGAPRRGLSASRSTRHVRLAVPLAAACVVGVAAGLLWLRRPSRSPAYPQTVHTVATANGQRASLELADGTRVVLGVHSVLRVPSDFGDSARQVVLEGEALFTVAHDPQHPFAVRAGNVIATDIGTRFDVRAYAGDGRVSVAVSEGRASVAVAKGHRLETLAAGDVATVLPSGATAVAVNQDLADYTAWAEGRLVFTHTPVREVVLTLGRWYDVDFTIDPRVGDVPISGEYAADLSLEEVLGLITHAAGVTYERVGRSITLKRSGITH